MEHVNCGSNRSRRLGNEKSTFKNRKPEQVLFQRRGSRILYLKDGVILGECNLGKYVTGDAGRHEKLAAFLAEMGW